jgi:hypothetical protein
MHVDYGASISNKQLVSTAVTPHEAPTADIHDASESSTTQKQLPLRRVDIVLSSSAHQQVNTLYSSPVDTVQDTCIASIDSDDRQ